MRLPFTFLIFTTLFLHCYGSGGQTTMRRFTSLQSCQKDRYLDSNSDTISEITLRSFLDCSQTCAKNDNCVAFSTCPVDGGRVLCKLFSSQSNGGCSGLNYKSGCKYREKESGDYNPCQNGGTYLGSKGKVCHCTIDWTGVFCERLYRDCKEATEYGRIQNGWLMVQPFNYPHPFEVYCTYGSVYLLRRSKSFSTSCPPRFRSSGNIEYFRKTQGGNPGQDCDYFLGLDKLRAILLQGVYVMSTLMQYHFINMTKPYSMTARYINFTVANRSSGFAMNHNKYVADTNPKNRIAEQLFLDDRPRRFCTPDDVNCACAASKNTSWWYGSDCNSEFPLTALPRVDSKAKADLNILIDGIMTHLSLVTMTFYPYYYY